MPAQIYILLLIISFLLTASLRYYAFQNDVIDVPNDRSSHTTPTPRGGGLAIVITFISGLARK